VPRGRSAPRWGRAGEGCARARQADTACKMNGSTMKVFLAAIIFVARGLGAQGVARTYTAVYTTGKDTSAIERLVIDNGRWTGDIATAGGGHLTWSFQETSPGVSGPLLLSVFQRNGDSLPSQRVLFTNTDDRIRADFQI